jgi:spore coat protein U-like protein
MLFKKSALVLAAALLAISGTQAGTVTTNLAVSINASAFDPLTTCTVGNLGFTNPGYISGTTIATSVLISPLVTCTGTNPIPYTVNANAGGNALGGTRRAVSGVNFINYNLKQGGGTSTLEFDQNPGASFGGTPITGTTGGAGNNSYFSFRLVVPAGQTVATGTYTDTVVLTTTF